MVKRDVEDTKIPQWFLVHTYSGSEKKVLAELEERIKGYGLEGRILNVFLPF